jgi:hypothetical protein
LTARGRSLDGRWTIHIDPLLSTQENVIELVVFHSLLSNLSLGVRAQLGCIPSDRDISQCLGWSLVESVAVGR